MKIQHDQSGGNTVAAVIGNRLILHSIDRQNQPTVCAKPAEASDESRVEFIAFRRGGRQFPLPEEEAALAIADTAD